MEACEVCGFVWDEVEPRAAMPRLTAATWQLAGLLRTEPARVQERPAVERWSALEYAGHVRDVILNLRDRIILGLAEDNPVPKAMHGTLRVERLYGPDTPDVVATELELAAGLFVRGFAGLGDDDWARPVYYGWPTGATRTLGWVAAQTVHEAEHHLADARENLGLAG
jgi:hypothetical protein